MPSADMRLTNLCNHCGECCGALNPQLERVQPWPADWPTSTSSWSRASLRSHVLFSWLEHPYISGFRPSSVEVDGEVFEYVWIQNVGLVKSASQQHCPFLRPYVDEETGRCALYGSSHHKVWESYCGRFPPARLSLEDAVAMLEQYPSCSHEYEPVLDE